MENVRLVTGRSKVNVVMVLFASTREFDLEESDSGDWCSTNGLLYPPTGPAWTARLLFSVRFRLPNWMLDPL